MVMTSSSDPKTETSSDSKPPRINEAPSEKLGDSSPELVGDSNSSEKLGDSSTVWEEDPVKEGDEEEESGLCLFMKEGGCKDIFTAWEVCVEEAKKKKEDIVTECMELTSTLYKCMVAHSDYYQPILTMDKIVSEEQARLEMEEAENNKIEEEEMAARKLAQGV
ncbi:hypothetical protein Bca4012_021740 [Brassica carinata]